ncbi:hypothetical protein CVT26_008240 [Gymnopilus dilepis]|uniref:Novel STAND NTPase 1 domain-containing protein n=1 Tax=Gymnopilus dilepis TaxID=231916 RepID=A0A409XXE4_9AGAR|nr:hypothetical protein CVT26_008240 [Gymnopilus dilepis]
MGALDGCLSRLSVALEKFKLASDLRDSDLLNAVHKRIAMMARQVDIISQDMKHVVAAVDNIQQNFDQVMRRVKRSETLTSLNTFAHQDMPLKPGVFFGRDSLVEEIVQLFMEKETSHICILGPGGMGKTSVSLAVVESPSIQARFQDKCIWVPCIGATSTTLLLEILYVQLRIPGDRQATLDKIISGLSDSTQPHLILLDNFETPWNAPEGSQKEVEDLLRQLVQLDHIAILMTMRGSYPPCDDSIVWNTMNIEPADEDACLRMYHTINPRSKDDADVGRLLDVLGYMPFAVTLMASLGKEGHSTAGELLQAWLEAGTDIISINPERSMNRSISLSVDSDLVKQNSSAILLLSILSLLPAGTTKNNLRWWAPTLKMSMLPSAIATLSEAALLLEIKQQDSGSPVFFVVPVVQSFMQQNNRISDEVRKQLATSCCRYVQDHACRYDDPEFQCRSNALASEDTNIQAVLFGARGALNYDPSESVVKTLLAFCWYRCDTKPSPDLAEQTVAAAGVFGKKEYVAEAEWCLGKTYHFVGKSKLAHEHLNRAYQLFNWSEHSDVHWQKVIGRCGIDLIQAARPVCALPDVIELAQDVEIKCRTLPDHQIHGRVLLQLGFILQKSGRTEEAWTYLHPAKTVLEAGGNSLDIAEVYQAIGRLHLQQKQFTEAKDAIEEAWRHAEMSKIPSIQAQVSLELGDILYSLDRDAEAMKYVEIGLIMSSQVGHIRELASALEYMGYGYLRRGDYQDAYSAYIAAEEKYLQGDAHIVHPERCKANGAKIKEKLSCPEESIGFERPFWSCDKSLLYLAYNPSDTPRKSTNEPRAGIPMKKYITATGKEVLTVLRSAAGLIPVPMLQDAIEIALKIIELCEESSAVEQKVKDLQDRVGHLMILILTHVTEENEEGDRAKVVNSAKTIEKYIELLLNTLRMVNRDLTEIQAQNRWVLAIYRDLNMRTIDDCMNRLSLANDLRDTELLMDLQARLRRMASKVDDIASDMKHVVTTVDDIRLELNDTRQTFDQIISKVKQSTASVSTNDIVRQRMPLKPEVFEGRDKMVTEIAELLSKEETSRVCLLGPGGMGKTSAALAVVEFTLVQEKFPPERRVWVPCVGASSASLLLEILFVQLQIAGDKQVTLEKIISHLSMTDEPLLMLLDNFETPWTAPGSQKEVEDTLRELARLKHVSILLTMRGKHPPCDRSIKWQQKDIQPTDEEASLRIYREIHPDSREDPDIPELLRALGYMPFAVTLMASLAREGQTASELLKAWSQSGPDIFPIEDEERNINQSIGLSVYSRLVQQNSNAVLLLSVLSLLPAGTTKENLRWWAPQLDKSMVPGAVATLSKAALLFESRQEGSESPVLFVIPVVQAFMQQHGRISDGIRRQTHSSCVNFVLAHACRYDETDFRVKSKALAAEDSNIQHVLFSPSTVPNRDVSEDVTGALIAFCWYRCDSKASPELAEHALAIATGSGNEKQIASATWCLGRSYILVSQYSLASGNLEAAYRLFCSLNDLPWQDFGAKCGVDLVDALSGEGEREEAVVRAQDVEKKCATLGDTRAHGRSLSFLGNALLHTEQIQEALACLEQAKAMLEECGSYVDKAEVHQILARVYYQKQQISEALAALQEALKHAEASEVPYLLAWISCDYGQLLFSMNRDVDAWKYIESALMMSSELGDVAGVAVALEYMGYGYLRQGRFQDANDAYGAAAEKYRSRAWPHDAVRCKQNQDRIAQRLREPDELVGFERPHWYMDKSFFYPQAEPTGMSEALPSGPAHTVDPSALT